MNKKLHTNILKPSPEQLNTLLELYQTGLLDDAEKLSISITQEFPEHPFAWKVFGAALKRMGKINESLVVCQKSVQLEPQDAEANSNLGVILQELGRLEEAETNYRKAITLKPDYVEAHSSLGNVLQVLGRLDEAETSLRYAITLKPDFSEVNNNLGITLKEMGRLDEAETNYRKAIELKPNFVEAHNNLGITLKEMGRLEEAVASYKKAIKLKPDFAEVHNNLGITLKEMGRLEEAVASYKKAIKLKPDFAKAHNSLGITLNEMGRLEEAVASNKKAIELKPDFVEVYNNLGVILQELGRLEEAVASYRKAIELKPDFAEAWYNLFFSLQAMKFQTSSIEDHLPLLDEQAPSEYALVLKSILRYRLNRGSLSSESSFNQVINILSSTDNTFVKNPEVLSSELITLSTPPKKITALVHFGRSGTGLLHSLIDGHTEVSTLPSIYFSEFFDYFTWKKITAGGWEEIVDCFVKTYEVLFDASSTVPVASKGKQTIDNIGRKEGMTNVGPEKNEVLLVDKKVFVKELKQLMSCYDELDALTFFKLVHSAYEVAIENTNEKKLIFYHIHNPDNYAQLNFLRLSPNTNWVTMVREPLLSCESWVSKSLPDNYTKVSHKIFQMLFEVDNIIFQNKNSIGVRLEDLKKHPKKTIQALCDWLGIKESDSLYEMTAQGKKWWGDPSSKNYEKDGMDPFGKSSINQKLGSVFSKNDQFILSTLFYPFNIRFGYAEENLKKFKNDLQIIKPMLDQMFDFEKKIAQNKNIDIKSFMKSGPYIFLRSGMIERWNTLIKFHTYPNMLKLLKID